MRHKTTMWVAVLAALSLAFLASSRIGFVSAQESGESGYSEAPGIGGFGGAGGSGGFGGGGGGGGFGGPSGSGALTAFGEHVYVLYQGTLYQYAAYDLALVKKIDDLDSAEPKKQTRRGRAVNQNGGAGGAGGDGADGDQGRAGGRGGNGGQGGGFGYGGIFGRSEDVAAYGEFVYVLQGTTLRKLAANGLKPVKKVTLDLQ